MVDIKQLIRDYEQKIYECEDQYRVFASMNMSKKALDPYLCVISDYKQFIEELIEIEKEVKEYPTIIQELRETARTHTILLNHLDKAIIRADKTNYDGMKWEAMKQFIDYYIYLCK